jgi:hypothetical protein
MTAAKVNMDNIVASVHIIHGSFYKFHDRWVHATTTTRVLRLQMEEPPTWRVVVNIINKLSQTADSGWSYSLGDGQGANSSSP